MNEQRQQGDSVQELELLQSYKQQVYMIALLGGVLIFLLSWFLSAPEDIFIRVLYPVFAVILGILAVLLQFALLPFRKMEFLMLVTVGAMVMSRLAWHFYFTSSVEEQLLPLAGGHYWAVGLLIVAGFVVLDYKQGLIAGTIVLLTSILIAVTGSVRQMGEPGVSHETVVYLVRVHIFMTLFLGLTSMVTTLRAKFQDALTRAEVLEHWANTDMLTGLANRRSFDVFINQQMEGAERYGRNLSVIIADIDKFKDINDQFGHAIGDEVLKHISRVLKNLLRKADFAARWGGDEFIIVAPEVRGTDAAKLVQRCRDEIAGDDVQGITVTMTFGIAEYHSGDTVDALLARADNMLYQGKEQGRDCVVSEQM
ncbi:MAG: diguanylate cyclase [Verrucomicrobiota bacterium]